MHITNPLLVPPLLPRQARAEALLEHIEQRVRGDWRDCANLQEGTVIIRAQAVRDYADEPQACLRGGQIARCILEETPVAIDPHHLFAASALLPAIDEAARKAAYDYLGTQPHLQGHSHHISMDYAKLIRMGVRGIFAEIAGYEAALGDTREDEEKRAFYQGVRLALEGLVQYGAHYRAEAIRLLAEESAPERQVELQRIIDALARVPWEPATTFFEAIQSMLLLHFGSRTQEMDSAVGRFDYYMAPYYARDLAEGRITREEAALLVQMLLAQLFELSRFSDALTLGGCAADGETPFYNDLTYYVLDAAMALYLPGPQIGFRYCPGQPRELLQRAMRCVQAGTGHPGFFNDPITIAALERTGMTREQAADYANCNCVELVSAGRSSIMSGYYYLNLTRMLEVQLNDGAPMQQRDAWNWLAEVPMPTAEVLAEAYPCFDDFYAAYLRYLDFALDSIIAHSNQQLQRMAGGTLMPLSSAFIDGCLANGRHAMAGGATCQQSFPTFVGIINAAEGLAAIRQAVFTEGRLSLADLANACRENYANEPLLREYLLRACPKYGNDDARVDELVNDLYTRICARLLREQNCYGQSFGAQFFGWQSHGMQGAYTAATPDGRQRGEAVSGTLGGDHGADRLGLTALLRSATGFDHTLASGGLAVNAALSPAMVQTDDDLERLIDLTLAYFAMGGMQIQYNCVSAETLHDAQAHPEAHRNLLVRVAGYADRFVCLAENLQDEIISRTEHREV